MNPESRPPRRPVILIIMDGVGVNPCRLNNAVAEAKTPNLDRIWSQHRTCLIEASGAAVGLPDGQMGNSEVGHLTLGAGTILKQDLVKISDSIDNGSFFSNATLQAAVQHARKLGRPLHLLGLVSDGGVHSHVDHLLALIELCRAEGVKPVVHMITDGRDTAPRSARDYLHRIETPLRDAQGVIATVSGRYYAMDRDRRWERVEKAWRVLIHGEGGQARSALEAIEQAYAQDLGDEFIVPTHIGGMPCIEQDDAVVFFNFRNDRPRELSEALAGDDFKGFKRCAAAPRPRLFTMTRYESSWDYPFVFERDEAGETLGHVVSAAGLSQLRAAETEKYPHVTFFFNGGRDEPLEGETRLLVDSPPVATYDLMPEMSAKGIADGVAEALSDGHYGLIVVNFANGDMVGHTGVPAAVIKAVETVDHEVGRLWDLAVERGWSIVLTADHGNADLMVDPASGEPHTQHTTFPVACTVYDSEPFELGCGHALPSIAPTILQLMGLAQPTSMQGRSLLLD